MLEDGVELREALDVAGAVLDIDCETEHELLLELEPVLEPELDGDPVEDKIREQNAIHRRREGLSAISFRSDNAR